MWHQTTLQLPAYPRGFHLITDKIINALPELTTVKVGLLHIFIQHSSASLTINENADPDVRGDFERFFNYAVKENAPFFEHTCEGPDVRVI